ncbi:MAG: LacI family transcriptional regulator [Kiritimatiellales bacterium]|nr:LacI family transcriptional regulator [Kiritimatiellales bacterium]MCF7864812.1 LacI family transcriptional regulator [Kiritimatiellales bacterium]
MASLNDVANELGISISLVSKVLNGRMGTTGARPELIEAIRRTAAEMNYQKNPAAVALSQGRHNAIGIFIHSFGRPGSGNVDALLHGVSSEARQKNQRFILDFFEREEEFLAFNDITNKSIMDGVLLGGLPHEELVEALLELKASSMPIVTIFDKQINPLLPNVSFDQVEMGRMATDHLIQQGSRKIAHIVDFEERCEGYCNALIQNDMPLNGKLVYREGGEDFSYARGRRAAQFFLDSKTSFDGVVAQSDEEAMGVMNVLLAAGVRIPDDVRIIGMDNAPYCDFAGVSLSSVSQNGVQRGRLALKMLMALIDGETVESVSIPPELFVRESTG